MTTAVWFMLLELDFCPIRPQRRVLEYAFVIGWATLISNSLCIFLGLADLTVLISCLAQNVLPSISVEPKSPLTMSSFVDPFFFKAFDWEMAQHVIFPGQWKWSTASATRVVANNDGVCANLNSIELHNTFFLAVAASIEVALLGTPLCCCLPVAWHFLWKYSLLAWSLFGYSFFISLARKMIQ